MSDCYYENCGDCTVTPRLEGRTCEVTCDDEPGNYPCLPRCDRRVVSYSERPEPRTPLRTPSHHEQHRGHRNDRYDREPVGHQKDIYHHRCCPPPPSRQSEPEPCCKTNCKPVKTKYIIPCYRYEDGRIVNQPTVLMRRACEVAVGARPRRKPLVEATYRSNPDHTEHRYISKDERNTPPNPVRNQMEKGGSEDL